MALSDDPVDRQPERRRLEDEDYDLVDFYATTNFAEVDILLDVLRDHDIHAFTREMEMPGFPTASGKRSEIRIVLQDDRLDDARRLIEETIAEGPEDSEGDDGQFLHQ